MTTFTVIPKRLLKRVMRRLHRKRYDLSTLLTQEHKKFASMKFDYEQAMVKLNQARKKHGMNAFSPRNSIHQLLFSCISLSSKVDTILEIGTYKGEAALLLSELFPSAHITTFDLPDTDPILTQSYGRNTEEEMRTYREEQRRNISNSRITFHQSNSFFIPEKVTGPFDLIWIDGGHLYPDVAWDICNAYHLCQTGGWILCDDVVLDRNGQRTAYVSPDSFEVIEYVRERTSIEVEYFLKKMHPDMAADPATRKFVAVIKKVK